jgi:hypothetical protein
VSGGRLAVQGAQEGTQLHVLGLFDGDSGDGLISSGCSAMMKMVHSLGHGPCVTEQLLR